MVTNKKDTFAACFIVDMGPEIPAIGWGDSAEQPMCRAQGRRVTTAGAFDGRERALQDPLGRELRTRPCASRSEFELFGFECRVFRFGVRAVANQVHTRFLMRNGRTAWMAIIWLLAMGTAFPVLARPAKATRLDVTYYYLPG